MMTQGLRQVVRVCGPGFRFGLTSLGTPTMTRQE